MPSSHMGSADDEYQTSQGSVEREFQRTSATGLTVSITHLTLERAPSHVSGRSPIVVIASLAPSRASSTGSTSARRSAAGGIAGLGTSSAGGESVSDSVATVDRVTFVESCVMEDVASLGVDALTSVDWRLVVLTGKTRYEVVFGDVTIVK